MSRRVVAPSQRSVADPTMFFWVFVHRHLPGHVREDSRLLLLREMDRFADTHALGTPPDTADEWPYARGAEVDLVKLHRSPAAYQPLVNRAKESPDGLLGCLGYGYLDTLVIQIVISLFGKRGSLREGWDEVDRLLRQGFQGDVLEAARQRAIGTSAVYWALADVAGEPAGTYAEDVAGLTETGSLRRADTDIGPLWRADVRTFPTAPSVSQDRWVLITPASKEIEEEANERYNQVQAGGPCDFARVALARHKVAFEEAQYLAAHAELERRQDSLDRRARWIVRTQEYHGAGLKDLRSPESAEFQEKLSRAHTSLADYSHSATEVKELRRTVEINRTNFLIGCVALISDEGKRRVESSPRQDEAAAGFLAQYPGPAREDGIFRRELGWMQGLSDQLDADIEYSERVMERHAASLRSGGEQLAIAGQRELGGVGGQGGLQAAAGVAAITSLVVVELLRTGNVLREDPLLAADLILFSVTATFAAVEGFSARRVKPGLQRFSFAAAAGFLAATLAAIPLASRLMDLMLSLPAFLGGAAVGWWAHRRLEFRARRRWRMARQREAEDVDIDKLIYATEELPELLEDLPPTTKHRLKDRASLLRKIETKNAERAQRLGITVDELRLRGEAYDMTNITDAIAIRYVVAPHRVPEVVDRVREVAHVEAIEHKNATTELRGGKYDGFRMNYKSVHMDLDLWGVGARKDVNLIAEVQVRTRVQNWFADWFHDIMYKAQPPPPVDEPAGWRSLVLRLLLVRRIVISARRAGAMGGTAPWLVRFFDQWHPWLNRPLARVAIRFSNWQLRRFREAMEWPDDAAQIDDPIQQV